MHKSFYILIHKLKQTDKQAVLLVVIVLGVYLSNLPFDYRNDLARKDYRRLLPSGDVVPNTFLPYLLLTEHTFAFNNIDEQLRVFDSNKKLPYFLIKPTESYFSAYPILTGLVAVPFYAIPVLLNKIPTLIYWSDLLKVLILGRLAASIITAFGVLLFYRILRLSAQDKNKTVIFFFSIFYALGTTTYSISSRGLWQHTVSQFLITLFIYLHLLYVRNASPKLGLIRYLVLGLTAITRPTNMVFAGIFYLYLFLSEKRKISLLKTFLIALPVLLTMLYNYNLFSNPLTEGYGARHDFRWTTPLTTSISGYLFSPARSLLFISPPLVLSLGYIVCLIRRKISTKQSGFYMALTTALLFHTLLYAKWYTWDGANGFGYRMLTDMLPILGLFAYLAFEQVKGKYRHLVWILCAYSIVIHLSAVYTLKSRCASTDNWTFNCLRPNFTYLQRYMVQ